MTAYGDPEYRAARLWLVLHATRCEWPGCHARARLTRPCATARRSSSRARLGVLRAAPVVSDAQPVGGRRGRESATSRRVAFASASRFVGSWIAIRRCTPLACGISGIPLRSFVLVGDQYAAGAHTDKNLKRTVAQVLVSQGLSQGSARGAMTVGHLSRLYADLKGITQNHARTVYVHEEETIDFAHKHEALTTWAISRYHGAADRGFNGTGYSVFLFEAASADRDMAELFHQAVSGTTESEDDPIHRLRQYQWRRFDTTGRRMSQPATVDAFVKCWNHVLAGDRLKVWKPPLYENIRFPDGFRNPLRGLP